MHEQDN